MRQGRARTGRGRTRTGQGPAKDRWRYRLTGNTMRGNTTESLREEYLQTTPKKVGFANFRGRSLEQSWRTLFLVHSRTCFPTAIGQKLRVVFAGGSFRKGVGVGLREHLRNPPRGTLIMKTKSQREPLGGFRRSSRRPSRRKVFLSETLGPVAPHRPCHFSPRLGEDGRALQGARRRGREARTFGGYGGCKPGKVDFELRLLSLKVQVFLCNSRRFSETALILLKNSGVSLAQNSDLF